MNRDLEWIYLIILSKRVEVVSLEVSSEDEDNMLIRLEWKTVHEDRDVIIIESMTNEYYCKLPKLKNNY